MNREFLDLYDRELKLFYEHAQEFAEEYPAIASNLGGVVRDRADPMVAGLLEGAAFLAARVQLKLKHEFPEFTDNLLEQLAPHYLAPTPSSVLVKFLPKYGDTALHEGRRFARGAALDAAYVEGKGGVACRYKLTSPVQLWSFELKDAAYFPSSSPLQALGVITRPDTVAGLRLTLSIRTAARAQDEAPSSELARRPENLFSTCKARELPVYLAGPEADANLLYEQLFGHCTGVWFRCVDAFNNPKVTQGSIEQIEQIGFDESAALIPRDDRIFHGFDLIREYFMFSRKFLGFNLRLDKKQLQSMPSNTIDIVFGFGEVNERLVAATKPEMLALFAAPAINLFEMTTDRVPIKKGQHEYQIVPDKSHYLDFEPHRVLDVSAHFPGSASKQPVRPLYGRASGASDAELYYTIRRLPRRRTIEERRYGAQSNYVGSDMFISLGASAQLGGDAPAPTELSLKALCSNRHLTEHLPLGRGGKDFLLLEDATTDVRCLAGPTMPREPVLRQLRSRAGDVHTGAVAWRLINMLSLNHLGLIERAAGENARALREILSAFADSLDSATEKKVRAVKQLDSRPVVRRIRQKGGIGPARGVEITLTLDEKGFEGSGAFLLGAVLDRFFSEYASFNHFTQLVVRTTERGEIKRWPPRIGVRRPL